MLCQCEHVLKWDDWAAVQEVAYVYMCVCVRENEAVKCVAELVLKSISGDPTASWYQFKITLTNTKSPTECVYLTIWCPDQKIIRLHGVFVQLLFNNRASYTYNSRTTGQTKTEGSIKKKKMRCRNKSGHCVAGEPLESHWRGNTHTHTHSNILIRIFSVSIRHVQKEVKSLRLLVKMPRIHILHERLNLVRPPFLSTTLELTQTSQICGKPDIRPNPAVSSDHVIQQKR